MYKQKLAVKDSIVQEGSELLVNNKKINQEVFDVKKLYDGTL